MKREEYKSNYSRWTAFRFIATLVGYGLLMGMWLYGMHGKKAEAKPLFQQQFATEYDSINRSWFDGELPRDTVIDTTTDTHIIAITNPTVTGRFIIRLNPQYNQTIQQGDLTLFHEMCHIKTWTEFEDHGPRWVACMRERAAKGAFDRLW